MTPDQDIRRASVDLTALLTKWGKLIIAGMRQRVTQQKGVDFRPMKPLAASTLAARKRAGIEGTKRLRATGALLQDGFVVEVEPLKLEIGLSDAPHPTSRTASGKGPVRPASYDQVGAWNDAATDSRPYNPRWWGVPAKMADDAVGQITAECERQLLASNVLGTTLTHTMRA